MSASFITMVIVDQVDTSDPSVPTLGRCGFIVVANGPMFDVDASEATCYVRGVDVDAFLRRHGVKLATPSPALVVGAVLSVQPIPVVDHLTALYEGLVDDSFNSVYNLPSFVHQLPALAAHIAELTA